MAMREIWHGLTMFAFLTLCIACQDGAVVDTPEPDLEAIAL